VIREEGLLENAKALGAGLLAGLAALAREHAAIADVRGAGLYLGVEIVTAPESKTPDRAAATAIVNGLRRRRVLISATGEAGNVLKIRPPLVFERADADRLLDELAAVLEEVPHRQRERSNSSATARMCSSASRRSSRAPVDSRAPGRVTIAKVS
jgi:4-aminobutyrate aminotransferase-like enzyme